MIVVLNNILGSFTAIASKSVPGMMLGHLFNIFNAHTFCGHQAEHQRV